MRRALHDMNGREIGYQVSALLVTALCLLGLIAQAFLFGPATGTSAATSHPRSAPAHKVHVILPDQAATRLDRLFGRPELALP